MKIAKINNHQSITNFLLAMLMLAPALVLFLLFVIIPVLQAGYFSLFRWKGYGSPTNFQWFGNFVTAFKNDIFRRALLNNFQIVVLSLVLQLPVAFLFALLIGRKPFPGSVVFRSFYFFPYVMAEIVTGIIWRFIYHPQFGIPTVLSPLFKGDFQEITLLGNPDTAFMAIFLVIFWKYIGLHMILYIAGLQDVPKELEDAAVIDGASKVQTVRHVIIPCMRGTIVISVFLSVTGSFNIFDIVWAMGQGGPVNATETLVTYLYNYGFKRSYFGYGSAVAVIIFLICLVFNLFYQKYVVGDANK